MLGLKEEAAVGKVTAGEPATAETAVNADEKRQTKGIPKCAEVISPPSADTDITTHNSESRELTCRSATGEFGEGCGVARGIGGEWGDHGQAFCRVDVKEETD